MPVYKHAEKNTVFEKGWACVIDHSPTTSPYFLDRLIE